MTKADDIVIRGFFQRDYIALRPVTEDIGHMSRLLVWDKGYSTKDAIHVATAIDAKCSVLDTFDLKLINKGSPASSNLRIIEPDRPYKLTLSLDRKST